MTDTERVVTRETLIAAVEDTRDDWWEADWLALSETIADAILAALPEAEPETGYVLVRENSGGVFADGTTNHTERRCNRFWDHERGIPHGCPDD